MNLPAVPQLHPPRLPNPETIRQSLGSLVLSQIRGRVASVTGDAVTVQGMTAPLGAICELMPPDAKPTLARVIGFDDTRPILAPMEAISALAAGDRVRLVSRSLTLRVGDSLCGRVIDAFGRPIDGKPLSDDLVRVSASRAAPDSLDRPPIDEPLQTGVRAIDAMLTCGVGQRLGIFAGSGVGKSTLLGMLTRGTTADRIVIAMVGERGREVQEFMQRALGAAGLKRSVVVVATSDKPAAQRLSAAWTATAIAEQFRDEGHRVLLLVDSVTRFAMAQRELGLAAGEPPTTRGYPPSVFNMLPQLVERAGRTTKGSITAFYTVLVEGDDNNEPISDTVRGLLDGHIVLNRKLAHRGHYPPIDIPESISRVANHLVTPETYQATLGIREHMVQYQTSEDLISIGAYRSGSDPRVDTAIAMRDPINDLLRQDANEITPIADSQARVQKLHQAASAALAQLNQPQAPAPKPA
ncbi:FliI/YscN family ATPase [Rhodopirellula baltica]|uniref:Flagellum-specific ATP synthase n=2 Tax=Rhodopirellula baltica TaxID=265606 RepID=F2AL91_RHOBT|nr:FliI/YscN family ATPase [Rhodopirellula baltica]EGF29567.1 flagellum-specific ATP synthase [Rhodopirellula baltica WH47]ELP30783.1 type III secretion system ATPase [Rhodopirellula baltica SWK14]